MNIFNTRPMDDIQENIDVMLKDSNTEQAQLLVYNDDFNTFDWVIQSFMEICEHTFEQSEQLSIIIHFTGKATIKTGPRDVLAPMKDALIERGISAVIESYATDQ